MKVCAIDIETTGMSWHDTILVVACAYGVYQNGHISGMQSAAKSLANKQLSLFDRPATIPEIRDWLAPIVADVDWVIFHNATFDLPYLYRSGILTPEQVSHKIYDTLIMASATDSHEFVGLESLCNEYGLGSVEWSTMKAQRTRLSSKDPAFTSRYCELDTQNTLMLFAKEYPKASEYYTREWIAREGKYTDLIARMRVRGLPVNRKNTIKLSLEMAAKASWHIRNTLLPNGIMSPNDNMHILAYLKRYNLCPDKRTDKGGISCDEEALLSVRDMLPPEGQEVIDAILLTRTTTKEDSTWLAGIIRELDSNDRIHPNFFAGGTVNSRLSCSHPNTQNIPKDLRPMIFRASQPGGSLLMLDYSQAQLRLAAMYSRENTMASMFAVEGADIHLQTAIALFGPEEGPKKRKYGKTCNFAVLFGSGASSVSDKMGVSIETARDVLRNYYQTFPRLYEANKLARERWQTKGYLVLASGKRRYAREIEKEKKIYSAFNALIQGAEAEVMKLAMLALDAKGFRLVNQVHDDIWLDIYPDEDIEAIGIEAQSIMANAVPYELAHRPTPAVAMPADITRYDRNETPVAISLEMGALAC